MKNLIIYPSFLCPFSCQFCIHKDKLSSNDLLDLSNIDLILPSIIDKIDNIIISGGEPMNLNKSYFDNLINKLKLFNKPITVESYAYDIKNYRDDVEYNLSYDFMARSRAMEVWNNLLTFPKKFNLTITLSPLLFKYHPNNLLKKLSVLPNLTSVEFIPYFKNKNSEFDITKNDCLTTFNKLILSSKLNIPFKLKNKEKIISKLLNNDIDDENIFMFPNGELKYQEFDGDILKYKNYTESSNLKLNYPENTYLYSDEILTWFKNNDN